MDFWNCKMEGDAFVRLSSCVALLNKSNQSSFGLSSAESIKDFKVVLCTGSLWSSEDFSEPETDLQQ